MPSEDLLSSFSDEMEELDPQYENRFEEIKNGSKPKLEMAWDDL